MSTLTATADWPTRVKPFGLPKSRRIRRQRDFDRIFRLRRKSGDGRLLVFGAPNDLPYSRVGVVVSRRHGNAVRRSRLKRQLREAFRLSQPDLPAGWDFILIPRQGADATLQEWQASLQKAARRLVRRFTEERSP